MAKVITQVGPLGKTFGNQDDFILNFQPEINFIEPEQVEVEPVPSVQETTLDDAHNETQKTIDSLNQVATLADATQKRIDQRVQSAGGLNIKLDPTKDFAAIAAMKRLYPDRTDPTSITYDDYRAALDCMQVSAVPPVSVSPSDILSAQTNPLKTDFGGYGNQQGENRPEISSDANAIQPLDLQSFQKDAILALFALLKPLIAKQIAKAVGL